MTDLSVRENISGKPRDGPSVLAPVRSIKWTIKRAPLRCCKTESGRNWDCGMMLCEIEACQWFFCIFYITDLGERKHRKWNLDLHTYSYKHKLTPFFHGDRPKLQNATCNDPYILLSPRPYSYIWSHTHAGCEYYEPNLFEEPHQKGQW